MANFELWKFESLVQFARESQRHIQHLEAEVAALTQDRKDLLEEIRKMIIKEEKNDT